MITMGQLRKLLNVTLDNIQLSGGKLQKFLISDTVEDPVTTKVILEFGGVVDGKSQCVLHSAVTINLLEMTLECIEDSGGRLLTFLIEDNDNLMKVILEFQPQASQSQKVHDKRDKAKCDIASNEGYKTYPPKPDKHVDSLLDRNSKSRQYEYHEHSYGGWNLPPPGTHRRHSIASSGVESDTESLRSRPASPPEHTEKAQSSTCVQSSSHDTPDKTKSLSFTFMQSSIAPLTPDKSKSYRPSSLPVNTGVGHKTQPVCHNPFVDMNIPHSEPDASSTNIKDKTLADKRAFMLGPTDKKDITPSRHFDPINSRPDGVTTAVDTQDKAKSASVEELLTQNSPMLIRNNKQSLSPTKPLSPPSSTKPSSLFTRLQPIPTSAQLLSGSQAPLVKFKDGDIKLSAAAKSPPLSTRHQVTAEVHHIKADAAETMKNKHSHIGNGTAISARDIEKSGKIVPTDSGPLQKGMVVDRGQLGKAVPTDSAEVEKIKPKESSTTGKLKTSGELGKIDTTDSGKLGKTVPRDTGKDISRLGNGAIAKNNNNDPPKGKSNSHIGNGNATAISDSPKEDDLKREAKDTVCPLPTIEKTTHVA